MSRHYKELRESWWLHSSGHLNDLYKGASDEGKENLYQHMYQHDVIDKEYPGYWRLAEKIRKELWPEEEDKRKEKKTWSEEDLIRFMRQNYGKMRKFTAYKGGNDNGFE